MNMQFLEIAKNGGCELLEKSRSLLEGNVIDAKRLDEPLAKNIDVESMNKDYDGSIRRSLDASDKRMETESNHEGLTDEEKAKLKAETGWSDEIINSIGSMEEAEIYKNAGLKEKEINGHKYLGRDDIDMDQEDEDGITNRERMERGRPPITKSGEEVELHHIGQKSDSPLAELTMEEHRGSGNDGILHDKTKESEIDRNEFGKERREHWKDRARDMEKGED